MLRQAMKRIGRSVGVIPLEFKSIGLDEVVGNCPHLTLDLHNWNKDLRAGPLLDSIVLSCVARAFMPAVCFEIGTGDGRSSSLLSGNTPEHTRILTLDPEFPANPVKGSVFRGEPESAKITQLGGSSMSFDFNPWFSQVNLVFVDGSHVFPDVLSDSEVAFRLLAPKGVVLWHDADRDTPDVLRALRACSRAKDICLIRGTRYAIYQS